MTVKNIHFRLGRDQFGAGRGAVKTSDGPAVVLGTWENNITLQRVHEEKDGERRTYGSPWAFHSKEEAREFLTLALEVVNDA